MALTHMLAHTAGVQDIHALTVDHGLRAGSADEAARVCRSVSDWPSVTSHVLTWQGEKPTARLQEAARAARYALMLTYCRTHDIKHLYLGHHGDDQMETVLFRLSKGSGLDGLAGMEAESVRDGVTLIRPLLHLTKSDLLDYCAAHDLPFVNDPTNENMEMARPRLRAARAALEAEGLTAKRISTTAARLARARNALEQMTDEVWANSLHRSDNNSLSFHYDLLKFHPVEIRLRLLQRIFSLLNPERNYAPRMEAIEKLEAQLFHQKPKTVTLGHCRFQVKFGNDSQRQLIIDKE